MTLPTSTRVTDPYETDGVQRDFEFDFPAFYNADTGHYGIEVRRLTALDYEVIDKSLYDIFLNDEDKSGFVRFHVAPMAGDDIYIAGDTTRSQQLNLINYGRYSAQSIEKAFDLIVALIQEFVSKVDEETRQRILADQALRDFLLIKFNQFTAEVTTKIDKHIGDINGFMSSLIPMFVCIMRKEIANYAETGMMQVINDFMDTEIEPLIAEKVNSYLEQTDFAGAVNQIVAPIAEYVPLPFESQKTYKVNQRVMLSNGVIVKNTVANNTANPNVNMTGWINVNDASLVFDESNKTQQAINNQVYKAWVSKSGGWAINDTVRTNNGDIVISTVDNNTKNPNTDRTGWVTLGNSNISFHGDIAYPEHSPFSYMSVNGIPISRKHNMRHYHAEKPSGFDWDAHGFRFWLDKDGILQSNISPDQYDVASKAVDKVEYFIRKGGSTLPTNTGTDPNNPQGSLTQILNNINTGNIQNAVIWIKPDVFTDGTVWGVGETVRINKNISIKPWNNSVTAPYLDTTDNPIVITTESTGLTWTLVSTGVYSTTRAATNAVVDEHVLNNLYDWSMYTKVDSLALCTSTSGSWFQNGTTLYVHTLDNRTPDAKLHVYVQKDNAYFLGGNYTAYLERVWLYGGTAPCYGTTALTNTTETIFLNKCRFRYAVNNGMSFYGMKYCIAYECESSYNGSDGYNYHADTTLTKKTQNVEFKCVAYRNGHAWSPIKGVNNGSTTHDGCDIVRAGVVAFENQGPNIADVNGGKSWLFNCISRNSLNPLGGAVNCDFYSSQNKMWLDHCDSSGSLYSAAAVGSGVRLYIRNCNLYARLSQAANFEWWPTSKFNY